MNDCRRVSSEQSTSPAADDCGEGWVRVRRALLSAYDKTGICEFAAELDEMGIELVASGGTFASLRTSGLPVTEVAELTGFAEILGGRVKTLHPAVHGGILAVRDDREHQQELVSLNIVRIDMVAVDLYPFEFAPHGLSEVQLTELIDIGGAALLRSAAKNHRYVCALSSRKGYCEVIKEMRRSDGRTHYRLRRKLAAEAFARTAAYDAAVAGWLARDEAGMPRQVVVSAPLERSLKYGENPHQRAGFFKIAGSHAFRQLCGPELGGNNLTDATAAYELVSELAAGDGYACAIIKHGSPCGAAVAGDQKTAFLAALNCDPLSAFGGVVAFDRPLEQECAKAVGEIFLEVVVAPDGMGEVRSILSRSKRLRLLCGPRPEPQRAGHEIRSVYGGVLVQDRDHEPVDRAGFQLVTQRAPSDDEVQGLEFACRIAKHTKSNAVILVRRTIAVGIGAGQSSRVDAARIAIMKAQDRASAGPHDGPLVAASDAFFPFEDAVRQLAESGVTAIVQPGGAKRDSEIVAAANSSNIAMVLTGRRHFRH